MESRERPGPGRLTGGQVRKRSRSVKRRKSRRSGGKSSSGGGEESSTKPNLKLFKMADNNNAEDYPDFKIYDDLSFTRPIDQVTPTVNRVIPNTQSADHFTRAANRTTSFTQPDDHSTERVGKAFMYPQNYSRAGTGDDRVIQGQGRLRLVTRGEDRVIPGMNHTLRVIPDEGRVITDEDPWRSSLITLEASYINQGGYMAGCTPPPPLPPRARRGLGPKPTRLQNYRDPGNYLRSRTPIF